MSETPVIRTMTRDDVDVAIRLAADEGWNPGLSDAETFYAADPEGFFISELNGQPIATISAVRYDADYGFVGLYIVTPEARGKGYGMELWNHAMQHLEGCNVGLDAVTEQEQTYMRVGFNTFYRSARFEGTGGGIRPDTVVDLADVDFARIAAYDRQCFPGDREPFLRSWLTASGARGFATKDNGELTGFGVIRPCGKGYKIGPLFADDAVAAETLFNALTASIPGESYYLDVIEPNEAAKNMASKYGLTEVFVTVRMYTKRKPEMALHKIFGVTSFELG